MWIVSNAIFGPRRRELKQGFHRAFSVPSGSAVQAGTNVCSRSGLKYNRRSTKCDDGFTSSASGSCERTRPRPAVRCGCRGTAARRRTGRARIRPGPARACAPARARGAGLGFTSTRSILLSQADAADKALAAGAAPGPLHGVPVGVKDIIDTCDMPTENGTVLHQGRQPREDALVVSRVRAAGGLIMGKTVTTELATYAPGKTRNPHDPGVAYPGRVLQRFGRGCRGGDGAAGNRHANQRFGHPARVVLWGGRVQTQRPRGYRARASCSSHLSSTSWACLRAVSMTRHCWSQCISGRDGRRTSVRLPQPPRRDSALPEPPCGSAWRPMRKRCSRNS